jgi:hypothetical protein
LGRGGFLLTFANAITVALNDRDVGMVQQTIEQRDDARCIREHFVPFFEGPIGGEDDWLELVTPVDDFVE